MSRHISSFALQYSDVSFSKLKNSSYDLIVTEGDPVPKGTAHPAISAAHVAQLQAQGRTVVGYINVAVTDDVRAYWNTAWTIDGTDTGALTASAPSWLTGQPTNGFGYIVKYWDAAWQNIVKAQALYLVQHGYDGVFIDDMGRYYDLIGQSDQPDGHALADRMIDFLKDIRTAIRAVNPNAYVVVNGDPYIGTWATGGLSGAEEAKFLKSFDKMLLENPSNATLNAAIANIGASKLLALYSAGSEESKLTAVLHAYELGIVAYAAPDQGYDALGTYVNPGTSGNDVLTGGDGPNKLSGLDGNDTIKGGAGDDTLNGGKGADLLTGGTGADRFVYTKAADSTGLTYDTIKDFDADSDAIDLKVAITGIDAPVNGGRLSNAHFATDLAAATTSLQPNHALVFTPDSGKVFLVVDLNGTAGYQDGADLVIRLTGAANLNHLDTGDFI